MESEERYHLQRLAQSSKESFVFLHRMYQSRVYHYCLRLVQQREAAEELCSDVFVKLWQKRAMLRADLPLGGLLFKISRDACLTYLRQVASQADLRAGFIEHYLRGVSDPALELDIYHYEGMALAEQAIEGLPPRCQQVFRLRYTKGLSLQEIADRLQISTNTVQNHLLKGTRTVREFLQRHADIVMALFLGLHLFS